MENKITFVSGSPGSGKSLITLMAALDIIKNDKQYGDIILVKPIVEVSRSIGLLPGTVQDKIYSYFTSFYDNLTKLIGPAQVSYLKDNHIIKDSILNFLRGSTFNSIGPNGKTIGSVVILDEGQNSTIHEMKTFISRMGEGSKLIILGDPEQIDIKLIRGEKCGLVDAIDRLMGISGIGLVEFNDDDIVRDPFLIEIMKRYKNS
jgi:phosphate starvation-inducible PhoH-like protein